MENKDCSQESDRVQPMPLPVLCYRMAYFVLPQLPFSDVDRTIGYFTRSEYPAGPLLYALSGKIIEVEINREAALSFQSHVVEMDCGNKAYVIEYPKPPAVDLSQGACVLAPHFSAIIRKQDFPEVTYFVLGQNPFNTGTTFRSVDANGLNSNMGAGPTPELTTFMQFLESRT